MKKFSLCVLIFLLITLFVSAVFDSSILSGTAICWAFSTSDNFHFEVVKVLLDVGADVNAKDENGETTLMIAITTGGYKKNRFTPEIRC